MTNVARVFSYGIACNALIFLDESKILSKLKDDFVSLDFLTKALQNPNIPGIESGLAALCFAGLVENSNLGYKLTREGHQVLNSFAQFRLWFGAYRKLLSKVTEFVDTDSMKLTCPEIDYKMVANGSAEIGIEYVDSALYECLRTLNFNGDVCDLGCGNGSRLSKICSILGKNGIGIDESIEALSVARKCVENVSINGSLTFEKRDVTKLDTRHESVGLVLQTFMTHHIVPSDHCIDVFRSYHKSFPNAKYFLLLDVVAPDDISNEPENFTPGFLYIHGIQGLKIRRKTDVKKILKESNFLIDQEIPLSLPNGYIWVLKFNREAGKSS